MRREQRAKLNKGAINDGGCSYVCVWGNGSSIDFPGEECEE